MVDDPDRSGGTGRVGLSRRGALLLAAGGLAQLSLPWAPALAGPSRSTDSPRAAVTALLDRRARALLTGDGAALLADVAPTAAAEQQEVADRLRQVPLAALSYRITSLPDHPAGAVELEAAADLEYRIRGVDDYPATVERRLRLVRGPDGWLLGEDRPAAGAALWDLGPVRTAEGRRSLVLGLAEPDALAGLATFADQAVPAVSGVWGSGWSERLVLIAAATEAQFAQLLDVGADSYQGIAAVTVAAADAPLRTPADRVLINPEAFRSLSDFGRRVVITHESTHVATRAATKPWTPLWLSEGVADYTAYRETGRTARQIAPELARDVAAGRLPTALPTDADFAAGAGGIAQAYELAWLACDLIARRFGVDGLTGFYRAVGAAGRPADAEGRDGQLDRVMRTRLGLGLEAFTRLWLTEVARV